MALSNIFREPRREITESAVGLAVFGAFVWADYTFAVWLQGETAGAFGREDTECPWIMGMFLGALAAVMVALLLFATHALGDGICNALQRNGVHLRPRNRP